MKVLVLSLKLIVTTLVFMYIYYYVDLSVVYEYSASVNILVLAGLILLVMLQKLAGALRQLLLLRFVSVITSFKDNLEIIFLSSFVSQLIFSFVSGDFVRTLWIQRKSVKFKDAIFIVLCDRFIGFVSLALLISMGLPYLARYVGVGIAAESIFLLVALSWVAIIMFCIFVRFFSLNKSHKYFNNFISNSSLNLSIPGGVTIVFYAFSAGVLTHLINCVIVYFIGVAIGLDLDFFSIFVVVMPVFLIMMFPLSFSGWGLREGAMIVALGFLGVPASSAVVISITFGITFFIASAIGFFFWWLSSTEGEFKRLTQKAN